MKKRRAKSLLNTRQVARNSCHWERSTADINSSDAWCNGDPVQGNKSLSVAQAKPPTANNSEQHRPKYL